jgi:sterol desaturase/sphingolipid hydroxylase (fatty acid hydroxylase superfamily)
VPLERLFPMRRQRVLRPAFATDLTFFLGQYFAFNLISFALVAAVAYRLGAPLAALAARQPTALVIVEAVLLGDVCVYFFHRACHRYPFLWRFHAVHHSSEHLDWLAAHREHPVDGILTQLAQNLPALLLGVGPGQLAAIATFRGMWAIFVHSNVRLPLGPLRWLLGAPELHHYHHARGRETMNFANLAPWLDLLFGTHHMPRDDERYELGIDEPGPRGWLPLLLSPLTTLIRKLRRPC